MRQACIVFALPLLFGAALLAISTNSRAAARNAARGEAVYGESCARCHGERGAGDGRAGQHLEHKPTAFNDKKLSTDDKLFKATHAGGKAVGQSSDMEGFPKLSDEQVHDVIAYIKTLAK